MENQMIRRAFLKACAAVFPISVLANRETQAEDVIVSVGRGDRGQVYDASGEKVSVCIEANLTTGRCVVCELSMHGCKIIRKGTSEVAKKVFYHPAPMRFEPYT